MYIYTHTELNELLFTGQEFFLTQGFHPGDSLECYHRCTQYLSGLCSKSSKHLFIIRSKDF